MLVIIALIAGVTLAGVFATANQLIGYAMSALTLAATLTLILCS